MLKHKRMIVVSESDWSNFVSTVYGRPYRLQQQEGCMDRCNITLTVSDGAADFENDSIPEVINGTVMGVSFEAWLQRDPNKPVGDGKYFDWQIDMFWERNFYPNLQMVANDLHMKGLIEPGEYLIEVDW